MAHTASLPRPSDRLRESIASYDACPAEYAERFAKLDPSPYVERVYKEVGDWSRCRVLDVGCGTGRDAKIFTELGAAVTGIDLSKEMVAWSRRVVPEANFVLANALALPARSGSFGLVWSLASLVHLDLSQTERALQEMARVLDDNGVLFLSVPWGVEPEWRADDAGGRRWFRYYRSAHELQSFLESSGLRILALEDTPGLVAGRWVNVVCRRKLAA